MRKKRECVLVNDHTYTILRNYGHRKDGYVYMVSDGQDMYRMKEYSPLKLESVLNDYERLKECHILMPVCKEVDYEKGIVVKEWIDGKSAFSLIQKRELEETYLDQLREMAEIVEKEGFCLDYFPTHFICEDKKLYYVHYECLEKTEKTQFDSCVKRFWIAPEVF